MAVEFPTSEEGSLLRSVIITSTCGEGPVSQSFAQYFRRKIPRIRVRYCDWRRFLIQLVDPLDSVLKADDLLCVLLLRFEDWDHFRAHALNPEVDPSYALVRKKVIETISVIDSATQHSTTRFAVCLLPPSPLVATVSHLLGFFDEMETLLRDSLGIYEQVQIMRVPHGQHVSQQLEFVDLLRVVNAGSEEEVS